MNFQRIFLLFALLTFPLTAQTNQQGQNENSEDTPENVSDEENRKRRWQAKLPGGAYAVKLDSITSISKSEYVLDGNLIVTEVTIDTTGNSLARFYYIEPITQSASGTAGRITSRARELARKAAKRTTTDKIAEMAQKNYPSTTHAHTVEFRLATKGELNALYSSVYTAWDTGKGRDLSVEEEGESEEGER